MKIVVLGGGISTERQVSLVTATSVCKALRSLGHQAIFVDMFFGLEDYTGDLSRVFEAEDGFCRETQISTEAPDLKTIIASRKDNSNGRLGNRVLDVCKMADCVFLGLHGADGEDGRIQATFDLLGIPYTGSGSLGSALGMNKAYTKQIMLCNGVPTAPYVQEAPCVVKEVNGGSSIGTWVCKTDAELQNALQAVQGEYLIEKFVPGREFTVPVLDDHALDVIEIVAPDGNFDYVSKYQSGDAGARELCPAPIPEADSRRMQELALKLHRALGLDVYSRTDFIMDAEGGLWCLEVNTLPGMTGNSLVPKAAKAAGYAYPEFCMKIIELSLKAREKK